MTYIKVKDKSNLVRDHETGAIINNDENEYLNYISFRDKNKLNKEKIDRIEDDLNNLKSDLDDIKNLLHELIKKSF